MLKTYELIGAAFRLDALPAPATERQIIDYLLDRALRAQGSSASIRSAISMLPRKPAMRR